MYSHWQVHFITGATRDIKLWSRGTCVASVLTAHNSQINQIQTLDLPPFANSSPTDLNRSEDLNGSSTYLLTCGKDKSLKMWKTTRHPHGHLCISQQSTVSASNQINCMQPLTADLVLVGLNDGHIA